MKFMVCFRVSSVSPGYPNITDMETDSPACFAHLIAFSFCSTVVPFFMASKIFWLPDSTPKETSSQPASLILVNIFGETRSTLVWQSHGIPIFLFLISSQIFNALSTSNVNMSS